MTNYSVGRTIGRAIIFVVCLAAFLSLFSCASTPTGEPERIQLRSGQWCEIHGSKIVGCERNNRKFAETVQDIEAIVGEQDET